MLFFVSSLFFSLLGLPARADDVCYAPVDVVQVQDMTSSFDDRWPAMADQIGEVIDTLYSINPNSRFGFATFGDKPLTADGHSLGYEQDYCLHVDVQISEPSSSRMTKLFEHYTETAQGGGADWPEAVFEGLQRALLAPQMGWQTRANTSRIAVVVTDATSHMPGDVAKLTGINLPANKLTTDDLLPNENTGCAQFEYPSLEQVAAAVQQANVTLIFIVAPGGSYAADGTFSPAASLANWGRRYWKEDGLQLWYEDQLASVGIEAIVQTMDQEMTVYAQAFKAAIERFQSWRCVTTTAVPDGETTTSPPTTLTPAETTTDGSETLPSAPTTHEAPILSTGGETAASGETTTPATTSAAPTETPAPGSTTACCGDCCEESCGCGFSEIRIDLSIVLSRDGSVLTFGEGDEAIQIPTRRLMH